MFLRSTCRGRVAFLLMILANCVSDAHPPDDEGHHQHHESSPQTSALLLPDLSGPRPWSDKPVLNDPDRFHFAIMSDRTGGHRPGIWMRGVQVLNLMRPEFVVSIGDLIEGYTTDEAMLQKEWEEFLGFVAQLEMRFFFVAGNHDVTNPVMHRIWRERFGAKWYSFDYKNVHFLCLCSEDLNARIGQEQLDWLTQDLKEHADARWTLVFLHKPLWVYAERAEATGNPDETNWQKVEELLVSRPHLVFAGHHHRYVRFDRNGTSYFQLATTGGGSALRGEPYGEFDHVVWVTMEKDGPRIANLRLDGVLPADVATEKSVARFRQFLEKSLVEIAPVLVETGKEFQEGVVPIRLTNEFDQTIQLDGTIEGLPLRGLTAETTTLSLKAEAGASQAFDFHFRVAEPIPIVDFANSTLTAKLRTTGEDPLIAEVVLPVTIAHRHICAPLEITLDGKLEEWSGLECATPENPRIIGASHQWKGLTDCSVRFRVAYNETHLLFGGHVNDDVLLHNVDSLFFLIDPRDLSERSRKNPAPSMYNILSFNVDLSKGPEAATVMAGRVAGPQRPDGSQVALQLQDGGYDFEIAIPIQHVQGIQGADWKSFQLNCAIRDADESQDEFCSVPWRGSLHVGKTTAHYGHFFRDER